MSPEDVRAAIVVPAERAGLLFEPPSLVEQILKDAGADEGMLPLLQYALRETWVHREGHRLTGTAYLLAGRVAGVIEETAKRTYEALTESQKVAARRLFLGLVVPGEGQLDTRARIGMPSDPSMRAVVQRFADPRARLLVVSTAPAGLPAASGVATTAAGEGTVDFAATVEVAHEALIRNWQTLRIWIDESREKLRARAAIWQQQKEWEDRGRDPALLLQSGFQLERGRDLLDGQGDVPVDDLKEYIEYSLEYRKGKEEEEATEKMRVKAFDAASEVERATANIFALDKVLEKICAAVEKETDFQFTAIQLKDKEAKTVQTVYGRGSTDNWYSIARHSYQIDPKLGPERPELWDIQAHIAAASDPPRIEIIRGRDSRFDQFIFKKFHHHNVSRVFAPIILAGNAGALKTCRWNSKTVPPLVDKPTHTDSRTIMELSSEDLQSLRQFGPIEVIGTIEAGYNDPTTVSSNAAEHLARLAGEHAGDLWGASLENVFAVIASSAKRMVNADSSSLHLLLDPEGERYIYEAWAGPRCDEGTGLRPRTRAAFPIDLSEEQSRLYSTPYPAHRQPLSKNGELRVLFNRQHSFSRGETAWLNFFARRAGEAIRQATYYMLAQENARRLANFNSMANDLADNPAAEDLLDDIAGNATNAFGADIVTLYEYDAENRRFDPEIGTAGRFIEFEKTKYARLHENSAPLLLIQHDKNLFSEEARRSPILFAPVQKSQPHQRFLERERIVSTAGIILRASKQVVGIMFVNYRNRRYFSEKDQNSMQTLASTAAVAIRTRRQFRSGFGRPYAGVVQTGDDRLSPVSKSEGSFPNRDPG
jgi:hypothetical protein